MGVHACATSGCLGKTIVKLTPNGQTKTEMNHMPHCRLSHYNHFEGVGPTRPLSEWKPPTRQVSVKVVEAVKQEVQMIQRGLE